MATTFQRPVNNFKSTLASTHTSGSGTLVLQSGDGTLLGALGSNQVYRITAVTSPGASETIVGIFEATGKSTDTLTGVTAVEGYSDSTISSGTPVQVRATAKTFSDLQTAINNLEAAVISESSITGTTTISSALSSMGKYYVCSGTSSNYTVTLPTIDSTYDGYTIGFRMDGALTKLVTITGTGTQTIDGTLARVMWTSETCILQARGSKWYKLSGRTIPFTSLVKRTVSSQSIGTSAWTQIVMDTVVTDAGNIFDSGNGRFNIPRTSLYQSVTSIFDNSGNSGFAALGFGLNSADPVSTGGYQSFNASPRSGAFTTLIPATAGNYLCATCYASSAGMTLYNGGDSSPKLSIVEVPSW